MEIHLSLVCFHKTSAYILPRLKHISSAKLVLMSHNPIKPMELFLRERAVSDLDEVAKLAEHFDNCSVDIFYMCFIFLSSGFMFYYFTVLV